MHMSRPTITLLLSAFLPGSVRPVHGIFVETRLQEVVNRDWHGIDWMATADALTNLHLLVIEDRFVRKALDVQARSLGLSERATLEGLVHRAAFPTHAAVSGISLQPDVTSYASPPKLMECLVLVETIVASNSENLLEILTGGQDGAMFDDYERGDLAERFVEPFRAHDRRYRLSVAL
jgi:hypothetical protein